MQLKSILLLAFLSGCVCTELGLQIPVNISNSKWCTDVMNPVMDYLLRSDFMRTLILSQPIPSEGFSSLGFRISELQVNGTERLERDGSLYVIVRSGNILIVQGALRVPEVTSSFLARFSIFKPDTIRMVIRDTVVKFGVQVRLETGQRATLMSLRVADLGRVEVLSSGRMSTLIRRAAGNRVTRSRFAKLISSMIGAIVGEQLRLNPLL